VSLTLSIIVDVNSSCHSPADECYYHET